MATGRRSGRQQKKNADLFTRFSRLSLWAVAAIVLIVGLVVAVKSAQLKKEIRSYDEKISINNTLIEEQNRITEELKEEYDRINTLSYIEQVAREHLHLEYEDAVWFTPDDTGSKR
ncbi:MAG: hypothetical protein J5825_06725 [Lachnospiraceae bacterium]|nr:hypothetical protein [Lachnospiraceae bacterium]